MVIQKSKKKIAIIIIFVALVIISGTIAMIYSNFDKTLSASEVSNITKNKKLLFSDDFEGNVLNSDKWQTCYDTYSEKYGGCTNYGNWESEWYKKSQVVVKQGYLTLEAKKQKIKGDNKYGVEQDYSYISGMVSTGSANTTSSPKWDGSYGYYEARMMIPYGQGVWPAFWLLPSDHKWPPEIDIMETVGSKPNQVLNTYFWPKEDGSPAKDSSEYDYGTNISDTWHVYAVDWKPNSIDWYMDGKKIKHAEGVNIPSKKMQIILNLAIGGMLPGNPDETTPDKVVMLVDYVRVYAN